LVSTVDDQAVPKIIDFGIAKAVSRPLTDSTLFTEQDQLVGTPEYMSPEQADAAGEDIDTRSDIYSLGVVLYQLLAGVLPFDSGTLREGGIDHVRQVICEQDPKTPSTRLNGLGEDAATVAQQRQTNVPSLTRRLSRELEWIPLKAIRKDRTRRYRSAAEFADDIENYLQGAPLIAGPESMTYRIGKFVRRHRVPAIAVASIAIVLILATLVSTVLYVHAARVAESHRRLLYVNQMALTHSAYRGADMDRARELLTNCPSDFRDFAWSYFWRQCDIALATPTIRQSDPVSAVAFSPTAETLVIASGNKIELWDPVTCRRKAILEEGHTGIVKSLSFSPDGTTLVSGSADQTAIIWDVAGRRKLGKLAKQKGTVVSVRFSNDGKTVVVGIATGKVVFWQVDNRKSDSIVLPEIDNTVYSLALSPDDKFLAATGIQKAILWDINTHQGEILGEHWAFVNSAVFFPDGQTLATAGNDGMLRVWDIRTRTLLETISAHAPVLSMAISPDGAILATGSVDNTIRLWDTSNWLEKARLRGHTLDVRCVAFSADGEVLASGSKDCTVKLWDPTPRKDSNTLKGHERIVNGIAFSHNGRQLFSTSYHPSDKRETVSTDFKGTTAVKMWDVASCEDLTAALGNLTCNSATCVDMSTVGSVLAFGTDDLELWDMVAKKSIGTLSHDSKGVLAAVFSPSGRMLATHTGIGDFTLRLWDVPTRKELIPPLEGYGSHVGAIAFSADGRRLAVPRSNASEVTLWNTSDLRDRHAERPIATLRADSGRFHAVAFSPPDGRILATGSSDTTIKLWDLATNAERITMTGHTSDVYSVAFSPDGRTLASGGRDGTVRLWNLVLHKQVAVLEGHGSAIWEVTFSPDGHTLASSSFDGTIRLWRAAAEHNIQSQSDPAK
jgi:WD40 repeat protein